MESGWRSARHPGLWEGNLVVSAPSTELLLISHCSFGGENFLLGTGFEFCFNTGLS
jgi:hypothetical protein